MYKVDPSDVIATRSQDEAYRLDKESGGLAGATKKSAKKGHALFPRFRALAADLDRSKVFELVELANKITDLANAKSAENAVCAKGCGHCCQVNVDISALEAAYIEEKTGYLVVEKPYNLPAKSKKIPYCPFLDQEKALCKIHQYRPIACRSFFTFDDFKFCEGSNQQHFISSAWNVSATKQVMDILSHCCGDEVKDIRGFFSET